MLIFSRPFVFFPCNQYGLYKKTIHSFMFLLTHVNGIYIAPIHWMLLSATGDTATIWCFMDFLRAKSNQGALTALARKQVSIRRMYWLCYVIIALFLSTLAGSLIWYLPAFVGLHWLSMKPTPIYPLPRTTNVPPNNKSSGNIICSKTVERNSNRRQFLLVNYSVLEGNSCLMVFCCSRVVVVLQTCPCKLHLVCISRCSNISSFYFKCVPTKARC